MPKTYQHKFPGLGRKRRNVLAGVLVAGMVTLLLLYLIVPWTAKSYLNQRVLADLGSYSGRVESVSLDLSQWAYVLHQMRIERTASSKNVPFFYVERFPIRLYWPGLRKGDLLFVARLVRPELNFIDAKKDRDDQRGRGTNWLRAAERVLPSSLHEVEIYQGTLSFQNPDQEPPVKITGERIMASLSHLSQDETGDTKLTGKGWLQAALLGGNLYATVDFNPANFNDFNFVANARSLDLTALNDFSRAYGNLDFEDGHGQVHAQINATNGKLDGYIKPSFEEVDIVSWEQDIEQQLDNPLRLLWEAGLGTVKTLLTNPGSGELATKIPIEGSIKQAELSTWEALGGIFKNAFVDALEPGFLSGNSHGQTDEQESDTVSKGPSGKP